MHSYGLALTISVLTGTLVALDLSDISAATVQLAPPTSTISYFTSPADDGVTALSIMPSTLPGITVPKADIGNGIFAVGSSTDREGLDTAEHDFEMPANDISDDSDAANADSDTDTDEDNDFVLI